MRPPRPPRPVGGSPLIRAAAQRLTPPKRKIAPVKPAVPYTNPPPPAGTTPSPNAVQAIQDELQRRKRGGRGPQLG